MCFLASKHILDLFVPRVVSISIAIVVSPTLQDNLGDGSDANCDIVFPATAQLTCERFDHHLGQTYVVLGQLG